MDHAVPALWRGRRFLAGRDAARCARADTSATPTLVGRAGGRPPAATGPSFDAAWRTSECRDSSRGCLGNPGLATRPGAASVLSQRNSCLPAHSARANRAQLHTLAPAEPGQIGTRGDLHAGSGVMAAHRAPQPAPLATTD